MVKVTLQIVAEIDEVDAKFPVEVVRERVENTACDAINVMEGCRVVKVQSTLWQEIGVDEESYLFTLTEA